MIHSSLGVQEMGPQRIGPFVEDMAGSSAEGLVSRAKRMAITPDAHSGLQAVEVHEMLLANRDPASIVNDAKFNLLRSAVIQRPDRQLGRNFLKVCQIKHMHTI